MSYVQSIPRLSCLRPKGRVECIRAASAQRPVAGHTRRQRSQRTRDRPGIRAPHALDTLGLRKGQQRFVEGAWRTLQ